MTQEEVDLIYEYLHENYEYKDGELIAKNNTKGKKKGEILGTLKIHPTGQAYYVGQIHINEKIYYRRIAWLNFIYFNKKYPKYIHYIDGNKLNTRIENLRNTKIRQDKSNIYQKNNKFYASIIIEGINITLGNYFLKETAEKAMNMAKELIEANISPKKIQDKVRDYFQCPIRKKESNLPVGVDFNKNKFRARMRQNGKKIDLGYFNSPDEAHQAYLKAKQEYENSKTLPTTSN